MPETPADTSQYTLKVAGQQFQLLTLSTYEEVSQLFSFTATVFKDDAALDISQFLRQDAEVVVSWGDGKTRSFAGLVTRFAQIAGGVPPDVENEYGEYEVEIVPKLWELTQRADCRIFQELTTDTIIKKVLDEAGMSGRYEVRLDKSYPQREFCVQYRETDFAFISRLMEEEGIFYFFTYDGGKDKMVIADGNARFDAASPDDSVKYKATSGILTEDEVLNQLEYHEEVFTGKVKYQDYDYREVAKHLLTDDAGSKFTDLEFYDYHPERYRQEGRGKTLAGMRRRAYAARGKLLSAYGPWRSASAGRTFTLDASYRADLKKKWIIIAAWHSASQLGESGVSYQTWVDAIPNDVEFRPVPQTPRPVMGPHTAEVVGPSGDVIYMDDLGRAKVQMHWDLDGKKDENSSCWIRVAQPFAGIDEQTQKKHGFQWHPQIGDEVVVGFLEGDPDKPLIVGSAYNDTARPLIKPEELIRQMILTRYQHRLLMDDKGAAITMNTGGSELLYMLDKNKDDGQVILATKGSESLRMEDNDDGVGNVILLHTVDNHVVQMASKDTADGIAIITKDGHKVVLSDHYHGILIRTENKHEMLLSDKDHTIHILSTDGHGIIIDDDKDTITIADSSGSHSLKIDAAGGRISITTTGDMVFTVGGNFSFSVGGSYSMSVGGDHSETIGGSSTTAIGSTMKLSVGATRKEMIGGSSTTTVGGSMAYRIGGSCGYTVGSTYRVRAATVQVQALATVKITGGASVTTTAPMVTSRASGINTLQGSLVKIN